jgi:hypothetical protein
MPQHMALLALVFMMSYVFVFDKLRWQIRHPNHGAAASASNRLSMRLPLSTSAWRQKVRSQSVRLLRAREVQLVGDAAATPTAESHLLGRDRIQQHGYGSWMVAGQKRSGQCGQCGKRSDGRLCATRQGVRLADRFQQTVRSARRGSDFHRLGSFGRPAGGAAKSPR